MLIQMEQLWSDLEMLGEKKSKSAKRATLLEAIRESYPHLLAQLARQSSLDYEMLKRAHYISSDFEQFENDEAVFTSIKCAWTQVYTYIFKQITRSTYQINGRPMCLLFKERPQMA